MPGALCYSRVVEGWAGGGELCAIPKGTERACIEWSVATCAAVGPRTVFWNDVGVTWWGDVGASVARRDQPAQGDMNGYAGRGPAGLGGEQCRGWGVENPSPRGSQWRSSAAKSMDPRVVSNEFSSVREQDRES